MTPISQIECQKKFGESLVATGRITPDHLRIALREQKDKPSLLGEILVRLSFLTEDALAESLSERTGHPLLSFDTLSVDPRLVKKWSRAQAIFYKALPLYETTDGLAVALADPYDLGAIDSLRRSLATEKKILIHITSASTQLKKIDLLYGHTTSLDHLITEMEGDKKNNGEESSPVIISLVEKLLSDALSLGASDIHLEPEENLVRVRYRIDGYLEPIREIHPSHWPALAQRIKLLAQLNISDRRSIQDGRFTHALEGRQIDCRLSVMPTLFGETIVVRLLDRQKNLLTLPQLGYSAATIETLAAIMDRPEGLTLVTGPTGSGKTTTLYALLQRLNSVDIKIATLEEPIEYQLPMARQTAVGDLSKIDFASGVRAVLRQDPDVILIGEIRDPETAQMALRAAMTGHRVLATMHCNDVFGAIPRLQDLGLSSRSLAGNISGIIAQRLVRRLCPECKISCPISPDEAVFLNVSSGSHAIPIGCAHCRNIGRAGRTVLAEILPITKKMDDLLLKDISLLSSNAPQEKFHSLQDDGIARVLNEEIALADLRRAIDLRRE